MNLHKRKAKIMIKCTINSDRIARSYAFPFLSFLLMVKHIEYFQPKTDHSDQSPCKNCKGMFSPVWNAWGGPSDLPDPDHFKFLLHLAILRYGKTGNKKRTTCLATLLQNELNSDVARFTTPIKPVLQQIRLLTGLNVGGKTRSCTFFVARFSVPLHRHDGRKLPGGREDDNIG